MVLYNIFEYADILNTDYAVWMMCYLVEKCDLLSLNHTAMKKAQGSYGSSALHYYRA